MPLITSELEEKLYEELHKGEYSCYLLYLEDDDMIQIDIGNRLYYVRYSHEHEVTKDKWTNDLTETFNTIESYLNNKKILLVRVM